MKRVFILLLCLYCGVTFAEHEIINTSFNAQSVERKVAISIYLPDGYNTEPLKNYPVIYFLHGAFSDHRPYVNSLTPILDQAIEQKKTIQPVIMVFPNSYYVKYGGPFWANSALTGNWRDYVAKDVVAFIDSSFRTIPAAEARTIMGFSDGGDGAMVIGLMHAEVFSTTIAFGGLYDWETIRGFIRTMILSEYSGPPYEYTPSKGWSQELFRVASAYSPNLDNPPYYVDYPLDVNGTVDEAILNKWKGYNADSLLIKLVHRLAPDVVFPPTTEHPLSDNFSPAGYPNIFFSCGSSDAVNIPGTRSLDKEFEGWGIPYRYLEFAGGHEMPNNILINEALPFADQNMPDPMITKVVKRSSPEFFKLWQAFPNPFNSGTVIRFRLDREFYTKLEIYNLLGVRIKILVSEQKAAGDYQIMWDGTDEKGEIAASGVYIYNLEIEGFSQTRKILKLK